jgi:outer membrane protein assembly factor BamD
MCNHASRLSLIIIIWYVASFIMKQSKNLIFLLVFTYLIASTYVQAESPPDSASEEDDEDGETNEIELYSEALRSYDGGRYMIAKTFYEKLLQNYPGSPLAQGAELKIADCLYFADRYTEAIAAYREFARVHTKHEARPYALFQIGLSFQKSYQGTKQDQTPLKEAIKQYVALVNEYPNSPFTKKAGTQMIEAEEELLKSEIAVIEFYERTDDDSAAIKRKGELKKLFGHLSLYKTLFNAENNTENKEVRSEPEKVISKEPKPTLVVSELELPPAKVNTPTATKTPSPTTETPIVNEVATLSPTSTVTLPIPTLTPTIVVTPTPTQELNIPSSNQKTLADLEAKQKITEKEIAHLSKEDEVDSDKEEKKTFLLSNACDYEMGVLKILLNFSSKPFLKSSTSTLKQLGFSNLVIFQEGFSTDALPAESNDHQWIKRRTISCIKNDNLEVTIQERIKIGSSDSFGPSSYLFVYINTVNTLKISIVNSTKPEALAIIAQE